MGLFDGTEAPRWLSSWYDKAREPNPGVAQAFMLGAKQAQEQRQFEALLPIKQQQADNDTAARILQEKLFAAKQENDNAIRAGYTALGETLADTTRQGTWDKPEGRARFYDVVAAHPWLAHDPQFKVMENQFDIADRAAAAAERARIQADARQSIQTERDASAMERTKLMEEGKSQRAADAIQSRADIADARIEGSGNKERIAAFRAGLPATKKSDGTYDMDKLNRWIGKFEAGSPLAEPVDDTVPALPEEIRKAAAKIDEKINAHRVSISEGDRKNGLDWWPGTTRDEDIKALEARKAELLKPYQKKTLLSPTPAVPVIKSFNSQSGSLTQ